MQDRWDRAKYADRSVEDLKGRYYSICNTLNKVGGHLQPPLGSGERRTGQTGRA